jgi:hypothetical protein
MLLRFADASHEGAVADEKSHDHGDHDPPFHPRTCAAARCAGVGENWGMEDPRLADYAVLWSEPGWRLWRTPGGRLVPISPDGRVGVDLKAFDDETFAALVVGRMVSAGVAVSDEPPAGIQELPTPPPGEYLMCRLGGAAVPAGWDEWAHWLVLDSNGLPVGSITEHHELIAHNTWGPATYTATHNPADHDGPPLWRHGGNATPDEAFAALLAAIENNP